MREFMHYITNAFYGATGWNEDNTYRELNVTARGTDPYWTQPQIPTIYYVGCLLLLYPTQGLTP